MNKAIEYIASHSCELRAKMTSAQWCHYRINEIATERGGVFSRAQREQIAAIEAMWKEMGGGPYVERADYDDSGITV